MRLLTIILTLFLSHLSFGQKTQNKTITIDSHLSFQNYEHFKRLILKSPDSEAEFIEGFEFEWGYTYKLKVKETKLKSTMSDGQMYKYALEKIISKVPDTSSFKIFLDANIYYHDAGSEAQEKNSSFKTINDSTFLYFDKVEMEVPTLLIDAFIPILKGKVRKSGTFVHVGEHKIRLIEL